jgi:hypothetical protein
MKKFSTKSVLLFAAAVALCAFAMPSMAGAVGWDPVGTEHTLDSSNVGFHSTTAAGTITSQCTASSFTTNVASSANLEITAATFGGDCTLLVNQGAGNLTCTATSTALGLPWTATSAGGTTNIQIHGITITIRVDQSSVGNCPLVGADIHITGTLSGGVFNNTTHVLELANATGLTGVSPVGSNPAFAKGTFTDTQNTLSAT